MPVVVQADLDGSEDSIQNLEFEGGLKLVAAAITNTHVLYNQLCARLRVQLGTSLVVTKHGDAGVILEVTPSSTAKVSDFMSSGDCIVVKRADEAETGVGEQGILQTSAVEDLTAIDSESDQSESEGGKTAAIAGLSRRPSRSAAVAARATFVEANAALDAMEARERKSDQRGKAKKQKRASSSSGGGVFGAAELLRGALRAEGTRNARKLTGGRSGASAQGRTASTSAISPRERKSDTFGGATISSEAKSSPAPPDANASVDSTGGAGASRQPEARRARALAALQARKQRSEGILTPDKAGHPSTAASVSPSMSQSWPSVHGRGSSVGDRAAATMTRPPQLPRSAQLPSQAMQDHTASARRMVLHDAMLQEAVPGAAKAIERRRVAAGAGSDGGDDDPRLTRARATHRTAVADLVGMTRDYVQTQYAINVASDRYAAALSRSYVVVPGAGEAEDARTPGVVLRAFPMPKRGEAPKGAGANAPVSQGGRRLGSGAMSKVRIRFPRVTSGHHCRWLEDVVEVTPRAVVGQVLEHALAHDSAADLRLPRLAEVSPRLFWGIVTCTTGRAEDALQDLLPGRDVSAAFHRQGIMSAKAQANAEQGILPPGRPTKRRRVEVDAAAGKQVPGTGQSSSSSSSASRSEPMGTALELEDGTLDLTGVDSGNDENDENDDSADVDPDEDEEEDEEEDEDVLQRGMEDIDGFETRSESEGEGEHGDPTMLGDSASTTAWFSISGLPSSAAYMPVSDAVRKSLPPDDGIAMAVLEVQGMDNDLVLSAVLSDGILQDLWPEDDMPLSAHPGFATSISESAGAGSSSVDVARSGKGGKDPLPRLYTWTPLRTAGSASGSASGSGWTLEQVCDPDLALMLRFLGLNELALAGSNVSGCLRAAAMGGSRAWKTAVEEACRSSRSGSATHEKDQQQEEDQGQGAPGVDVGVDAYLALAGCCAAMLALPEEGAESERGDSEQLLDEVAGSSSGSERSSSAVAPLGPLKALQEWLGSRKTKRRSELVLASCPRAVALAFDAAESVVEALQSRLSEQFTRDLCSHASRASARPSAELETRLRELLGSLQLAGGELPGMDEHLLATAIGDADAGQIASSSNAAGDDNLAVARAMLRSAADAAGSHLWLKQFSHQDRWLDQDGTLRSSTQWLDAMNSGQVTLA